MKKLLEPFSKITIHGGTYHSKFLIKDLERVALLAGVELAKEIEKCEGLGEFECFGRTYSLSSFGDTSYAEPLVIEAWLLSFMLENKLFDGILTSDEAKNILLEEYGVGYEEAFRPTNYVDSEDDDAYENAFFDQISIMAIEDKLILFLGVIAHSLGYQFDSVKTHFRGEGEKLNYDECNSELLASISAD